MTMVDGERHFTPSEYGKVGNAFWQQRSKRSSVHKILNMYIAAVCTFIHHLPFLLLFMSDKPYNFHYSLNCFIFYNWINHCITLSNILAVFSSSKCLFHWCLLCSFVCVASLHENSLFRDMITTNNFYMCTCYLFKFLALVANYAHGMKMIIKNYGGMIPSVEQQE